MKIITHYGWRFEPGPPARRATADTNGPLGLGILLYNKLFKLLTKNC
jgi:hypothetical protein